MKKSFLLTIAAFSLSVTSGIQPAVPKTVYAVDDLGNGAGYVQDRVIVVLTNEESRSLKEYTSEDFPELNVRDVIDLTSSSYRGFLARGKEVEPTEFGDSLSIGRFNRILRLDLEPDVYHDFDEIVSFLGDKPWILGLSPDYVVQEETVTPDDTFFSQQWGASTIGLPDAWEISTGSRFVSIGVIDSGIQATHSDLAAVVDVSKCADCSSGIPQNIGTSSYSGYHGTRVAGIIGAVGDNGFGVAGSVWNSKIASLRVTNTLANSVVSGWICAIDYATANNIQFLNISSGFYETDCDSSKVDALKVAIANYPGLVVCSAGNDNYDLVSVSHFPGGFTLPNLITVGASNNADQKCSFSNYSNSLVDLCAPGESLYSTEPSNTYGYDSGTSMAAPYVTGVAALIKSIRPELTPQEIKALILNNCDKLDSLAPYCKNGNRLNAHKAVRAATEQQTMHGDVNGDGYGDLILSGKDSQGKRVLTAMLGSSTGGFATVNSFPSARNFFYRDRGYAGDFDGDGRTDVAFQWNEGGYRNLLVYRGTSSGTFSEGVNLSSIRLHNGYAYPNSVHVMDVNGDGKDDFVVSFKNSAGKRWFLVYKGKATSPYLADASSYALCSTYDYLDDSEVFAGDFNGDGRGDVLVPYEDPDHLRQLMVFAGTPSGAFAEGANLSSAWNHQPELNPFSYHVGDFDGDGKSDFAVTYSNNLERDFLTYAGQSASPYLSDPSTWALQSFYAYRDSDRVLSGDFDGDGVSDLLIHYANSSGKRTLRLHKGVLGSGDFSVGTVTGTTNSHNDVTYPCGIYAFDVSGDGKDDLVVKWKNGSSNCTVYVYKGQSGGTFSSAVSKVTSVPYYAV